MKCIIQRSIYHRQFVFSQNISLRMNCHFLSTLIDQSYELFHAALKFIFRTQFSGRSNGAILCSLFHQPSFKQQLFLSLALCIRLGSLSEGAPLCWRHSNINTPSLQSTFHLPVWPSLSQRPFFRRFSIFLYFVSIHISLLLVKTYLLPCLCLTSIFLVQNFPCVAALL